MQELNVCAVFQKNGDEAPTILKYSQVYLPTIDKQARRKISKNGPLKDNTSVHAAIPVVVVRDLIKRENTMYSV